MKAILKKFNSTKLSKKLLFTFVLVSIIPIVFLQIFAFQVSKKDMKDKIDELMVNNLTQIAERVNLNMKVYTNILYQIYQDEQVIENVQKLQDEENHLKAVSYNQIIDRFKQYYNQDSGIRSIGIVCRDGSTVVYDFGTDSSMNTIWKNYGDMRETVMYKEAEEEAGMVLTDTISLRSEKEAGEFFHISKRMFDFDHLEQGSIGTIIMAVEEAVLGRACNNGTMTDRSINFIIGKNNNINSYPDGAFSGISINPQLSLEEFVRVTGYLRKQNMAINTHVDPGTGWTFCNAYDRDYMLKDIERMQRILSLVAVIVILTAFLMIMYIVKTLDTSVQSVVSGMQEVQKGNLDVIVPLQSFAEIGTIADNFNDMTVKVKQLIYDIEEAQKNQKNAEIRALEAQINPHFLYNTLDSINWMAIENEQYEISKMLRNLGVILRYSVNKSNQMVTMKEIADWLGKYISLHQMRFNDAFTYEINIDERVYQAKVYKLLLQPFIENSVLHGFKEMESGGLLRIDISMTEDTKTLIIIIEDNGKGMEKEVVDMFNTRSEAIRDDGRSIGLHNAFSRMHMYYGEAATWNVKSIIGMGTIVTLRLPL